MTDILIGLICIAAAVICLALAFLTVAIKRFSAFIEGEK